MGSASHLNTHKQTVCRYRTDRWTHLPGRLGGSIAASRLQEKPAGAREHSVADKPAAHNTKGAHMKTWAQASCDGLITGGIAAATTVGMLAVCGVRDNNSPVAPINAVSHVIWGDAALHQNQATFAHSLPGLLIHGASAIFWGVVYEKVFGQRRRPSMSATICEATLATAAIAAVDLKLVPDRLTPGFERRLSRASLFLVYAALGVGLAAGTRIVARRD